MAARQGGCCLALGAIPDGPRHIQEATAALLGHPTAQDAAAPATAAHDDGSGQPAALRARYRAHGGSGRGSGRGSAATRAGLPEHLFHQVHLIRVP